MSSSGQHVTELVSVSRELEMNSTRMWREIGPGVKVQSVGYKLAVGGRCLAKESILNQIDDKQTEKLSFLGGLF